MDLTYYREMEPFWGAWRIKRLIGEGSFGKVFEIEREDFGRFYRAAMKVITIPQNESEFKSILADGMDLKSATSYYRSFVEEVVDEFALMASLKGNSNIVSYEDHTVIEHKDNVGWDILIRMELLTPLLDHTNTEHPMRRSDVIKLGVDMCKALEYCQKQSIIHRDIKPENIFVSSNGDFKLGDFGIARTVEKTTSGLSRKGTYTYMAPEVYRGEKYGATVDIYSLGIVLYRLLNYNRAPFLPAFPAVITHSDRENSIARRVGGEPIPLPSQAQDKLGEIILKACAYEPKDRYAAPEQLRLDLEAVLNDVPNISTLEAEATEVVSGVKAEEDRDSDATVSMFGDIPPEQEKEFDWDNPTMIKQESQAKEDDKKKKSKKKEGKKKIGLFLGIGAAVVILLCLIIGVAGSGGGSRYEADSSSVNERSSWQKAEKTEKSEGESASEIQEESPYIYNTIYYGHYSLEEANSSSLDPENSFLKDMEFQQICGYELSVLPSSVTCHPDGSEYVIGYQPNMALGMSQKEMFQTIAIQKFGDEIAEQTEAFYEENIEGQRDCVDMRFHQRKGDGWNLHGYYKMRGSIMEVGFPYVDEAGMLSMEIVEFDIHFTGINMEISRNGYTNTLVPYSFQEDQGMVFLSGYASSSEDAYKGISSIFISDLMSDSPYVSVNFENEDIAIDPVMKLEGDNTITISWEEKWHKWDDGFGTSERVADPDSITFQFLSCEDIGFIMQVDDMIYLYQKTRQEYYAEALQDSIDNVSYDDIEMMDEEELQKAVTVQKSILEALQTSFEEAGIEVDINEKSGKVTMSNSVLFGLDDAKLSEEGEAYLDDFLKVYSSVILNSDRGYYEYIDGILLEGHTDSTGDYDYNQRLSEERAEAVDDYCYEKYPALSNYISTRGCASDNLICDEEGNEDREASRRVEFKVILDLDAF